MSDPTPNLSLTTVPSNTLQPSIPVNDSLQALDALVQPCIEDTLASPPTTAAGDVGKRWIIGASAIGAWAGKDGQIALCTAAGLWRYFVPAQGWAFRSRADGKLHVFDGSTWSAELRAADLGATLADYADDAAAAAGGVAVGMMYRNGSAVMVRAA